jgi:hypothetical protein
MAFPPTPFPVNRLAVLAAPGQYYAASATSGITPASGQSGIFSGPWLIEEQALNYNYCRVPEALYSSVSYGLSSYNQNMSVGQTLLSIQAHAYYNRRKSYETFHTSGWQQNQRFKVQSVSGDPYGGEYGTVSAGTFGPAGQVITSQKYYNRRTWVEGQDTKVSRTAQGYNFFMSDALAPYILQVPYAGNGDSQTQAMNNFEPFVTHSFLPGTSQDGAHGSWATNLPGGPQGTLHPGDPFATWANFMGQKTGGYITTQDTTDDVYVITDHLGFLVKDKQLVREGAQGNVLYPSLNGYAENHDGIPEYDPDRHTWY